MAQKRMFDKRVVSSDKFIDLPHSSKALYFMAGMEADDKGFFQPRKLQRMCGFNDDDFKILIAKGYFITFESGVMVVTDWNKNNWLDSRRVAETEYVDELNMLKLINDKYELESEKSIAKRMLSQYSIEENIIEENSICVSEDTTHTRFKKPTLEEVQKYCEERNNQVDAERFINFYESKGWKVGNQPMKDWKACIRTWEKEKPKVINPKWLNEDIKTQKATKEEEQEIKDLLKEFE